MSDRSDQQLSPGKVNTAAERLEEERFKHSMG